MLPDAEPETRLSDIDKARVGAVSEVFQTGGVPAVISLAKQVTLRRFVAAAISKVVENGNVFDSLVDAALGQGPKLDEFAIMLSSEAEARFQQGWKSRIMTRFRQERCTSVDIATLLLAWRDEPATWEFAASFGPDVERSYWQRKPVWPLQGTKEAIETAARKYLSVGRAVATLGAIGGVADGVSADIIFEALDKAVEEVNASPTQASNIVFYELEVIFEALQKRSEVPKIEIARREYAYLPLLEHGRRSLTLLRMMADDPAFFVSVLCDAFRPATGDAPEPNEITRARARKAYSLLTKFDLVPGHQGVEIDPVVLNKWVADVRELAAKEDRARIADEYIGHTLAQAPTDADGGWPHRAVREIIEKLRSENVEQGIEIERSNMRGVVTKAMYEGGKQERALADQARSWAKAAEKWPHTYAMLLEIAQSWDAHAEREDQRAKQDEMRYE